MSEPVLAVGALIQQGSKLLLVKRGRPPGEGLWSLPGGKVESGEKLEAAVRREIAEECGLEVEVGRLVGWVERRQSGHHFIILDYEARPLDGSAQPRAGDDAAAVGFFERSELGALGLVEGLADFLASHGL